MEAALAVDMEAMEANEEADTFLEARILASDAHHVLSGIPSVGAHNLVPDLVSCKHTSVQDI